MTEKPERIDFKYNLQIYFGLLKNYKWWFTLVIILILINEAVNTSTRFLFKAIVDGGTAFVAGSSTADTFMHILFIVAAIYIGLNILKSIVKWLHLHYLNKLEGELIVDLKRKFFNHIVTLSHAFHTTHRTGSMISRLTRGGRAIERMTDLIVFSVAPIIFQIIIVTVSLAYFDMTSAIVILITAAVFVCYSFIFQKIREPSSLQANDAEDYEKGVIADMFTNIDSIKHFGKEDYVKKRYATISEDTKKITVKSWNYYRWIDAGQSLIVAIGTFFVIYFPLVKFLNHELSLGTLVLIYTLYGGVVDPLFRFVSSMREYYIVMADFESLFEYNKIEQEVKDKPHAKPLQIRHGAVAFDHVTFHYGKRRIFNDFNLKINRDQKIALVGHSGSGKSTMVKLLYRLYDVDKGSITIDGIDIRDVKQESLREEMSIVPQECVLFDDTIYNNIAFSRPNATREEVMNAIRFAQLDKIIKEFPNKEETIVGERGVKLSGGEKQRVSIARAILANRKILVLDEATSALDSRTEQEIQAALKRLMKGRTTIIIAHRLSTIMSADKIIILKRGKIVQEGTHKQLIRQKGEYKNLWNIQKGGYIK